MGMVVGDEICYRSQISDLDSRPGSDCIKRNEDSGHESGNPVPNLLVHRALINDQRTFLPVRIIRVITGNELSAQIPSNSSSRGLSLPACKESRMRVSLSCPEIRV